jgi:SAM-dependent methyltransferase
VIQGMTLRPLIHLLGLVDDGSVEREVRLAGEYHRMQETFLVNVLRLSGLPVRSLLEIGCGFGRITKVLAQAFPESALQAVDLSEDQLANAHRYCDGCGNIAFGQHDLYSTQPLPGTGFDLAIAAEIFLHHPSRAVRGFIQKITASAPFIASIDWCEDWRTPVSPHVWIHNYRALYRDAGLDCASFVFPVKVDGKQQRLFVAGRALPDPLRRLERLLGYYTPDATEPAWESGSQTPRAALPDNWDVAVRTAVINKRAGGMGLISGRKAFQRPMAEGVELLHAIQDVYLDPQVTVA